MELRQYFSIVWKWAWLVVLSVCIAAASSLYASRSATPLYRTKTTLMVGRVIQNPDPSSSELYTGSQLAYIYAQLARKEPVLKGALISLGLPEGDWGALAGQVSANIVPQTQLLEIYVIDYDPVRAKALADAIAQQLIDQSPAGLNKSNPGEEAFTKEQLADLKSKLETAKSDQEKLKQELDAANSARQIQDLQNQINILDTKISDWQNTYAQLLLATQGGDVNVITMVEPASIPTIPISPNVKMNVMLAAVIGLVLAVGGIFMIEYLDDTVKTAEDVKRISNLPTLGNIGKLTGSDLKDMLIAFQQPSSPLTDSYRSLRMNIQFASVSKPIKTLIVTSPHPNEGKSTMIANLAVVYAQSGLKVIAVDTDLRQPTLHKFLSVDNQYGLSDLLLDSHGNVDHYLQKTEVENLFILSSGSMPPNPAELLGSDRMKQIIQDLSSRADIVLFDSPPVLVIIDAAVLGTCVDGVVLVNDVGRTRANDARRAVQNLRQLNINILGIILNRQSTREGGAYKYYKYYGGENHKQPGFFNLIWPKKKAPLVNEVKDHTVL